MLTDPAHVRQWQYGSVLETDWSPGSPIRFTAEWDGQRFEQWGTVLAFDPPVELRYSLFAPRPDLEDRPENHFTMTYRLAAESGGTTLTIVQQDSRPGADDLPEEEPDAENPVLLALKGLAESPPARP